MITPKERELLKGAIRRVFSRSELRREVVDKAVIKGYVDSERPRVTKWCKCQSCLQMVPKYLMEVDHIDPVIPIDKTLNDITFDELIARIWCNVKNLMAICKVCHKAKSKVENAERRRIKKEKSINKIP